MGAALSAEGIALSLCHLALFHFMEYLHIVFACYDLIK